MTTEVLMEIIKSTACCHGCWGFHNFL
jgi:hypothetical protein